MVTWAEAKESGRVVDKLNGAKRIAPQRGNTGGKKTCIYPDLVCAFDIETSSHVERVKKGKKYVPAGYSWMYIWQFCIEDFPFYGRTWDEFRELVRLISDNIGEKEKIVCYVHNLSYEAQFLLGIFQIGRNDIFAMEKRKIVKMFIEKIELRCGYIHSNMSLRKFLQYMGVPDQKEKIDYSTVYYPWSPLPSGVLSYAEKDVTGLCQAIRKEMNDDGDTLQTIPITSTGYVRRIAKKELEKISHYRVRAMQASKGEYIALKKALRGGDTHANRYYAGLILPNLRSRDIGSSYPFVMCARKMPVGGFTEIGEVTERYYRELIFKKKKAVIATLIFVNLRLKNDQWCDPPLSLSKTRHCIGAQEDNGRILACDYCETTITDIDFRIYDEVYEWDRLAFRITDAWVSSYGLIPEGIRKAIFDFYDKKTKLKGVDAYMYDKSKNKLNSFFGMACTDPLRDEWLFNPKTRQIELQDFDVEKSINKQKNKIAMPFAWGVWITSHARKRLYDGLRIAGKNAVYWDTDSVKYISTPEIEAAFDNYNAAVIAEDSELGLFAKSKDGDIHYMGVFEVDEEYNRFITLGAKKYAYENPDLHITVAGVSKKDGAEELGRLENFREGFIFRKAAGKLLIYNDDDDFHVNVEDHDLHVTRNVCIADNTYRLSLTPAYASLIFYSEKMNINDLKRKAINESIFR